MFIQPVSITLNGRVGKKIKLSYKYDNEVTLITSITSPCDCTSAYNDSNNKSIEVEYTPLPVPIHLKQQKIKSYSTTKELTVKYNTIDGIENTQKLLFTATINE